MSKYQAVSLQTRWYCMSYFLLTEYLPRIDHCLLREKNWIAGNNCNREVLVISWTGADIYDFYNKFQAFWLHAAIYDTGTCFLQQRAWSFKRLVKSCERHLLWSFNKRFAQNISRILDSFKQIRNVLSQNVKLIENLLSGKENVKQICKWIFPLSFACPFSLSRSRIKRSRLTKEVITG